MPVSGAQTVPNGYLASKQRLNEKTRVEAHQPGALRTHQAPALLGSLAQEAVMTQPIRPIAFLLPAFLLLTASPAAFAQIATTTTDAVPSAVSTEVQGLAPQLVDFAGSAQNFQSLVNGLAGGVPVTLVTLAADGTMQTTTFTPNGTLSSVQIAQTLEAARQQLISRGIAAPTAQQIGVTLAGGSLPTIAGNVPVTGLVPVTVATTSATAVTQPAIPSPAAVAARNVPATGFGAAPLGVAPSTTATTTPADTSASTGSSVTTTTTTAAPPPRFTSDTPTLHNISETPTPSIGVAPTAAAPNGLPSPAAQIQQRR
jgi:hypothetical protein